MNYSEEDIKLARKQAVYALRTATDDEVHRFTGVIGNYWDANAPVCAIGVIARALNIDVITAPSFKGRDEIYTAVADKLDLQADPGNAPNSGEVRCNGIWRMNDDGIPWRYIGDSLARAWEID